jgi:hypothetical protein
MPIVRLIASTIVLLASTTVATADTAPATARVAVIPGIAVNVDSARVDALGQDLAAALSAELVVEAVGGVEVRRQLPAEGLPADCIAKPECLADTAKRVGASQLLFIVVVDTGVGGALQIDSTWIDVPSGRTASRPAIAVAPGADPKTRFVSAAPSLLPDAPVRPKPKGVDGRMSERVPRHYTTGAKITTGLAVAGLGVGLGFGLAARSQYNECNVQPAAPIGCDDKHASIRRRALIADIGYGVAIAGALTTAVLIAISGEESRLIVEPTPQGVAVSAFGRF